MLQRSIIVLCLIAPVAALAQTRARAPGNLGGTTEELAAWQATEDGKWVRARELADKLLDKRADSFAGHYVMGLAMHYGEGDLARAVWHLERAAALFEKRYGTVPPDDAPWRWHEMTLRELASTLGEMERPGPELDVLDKYDRAYTPKRLAQRVWPLMKLRRFDDARTSARLAIASGVREQKIIARSDLCAAECEAGDRDGAYSACTAALEDFRNQPTGGQVEHSNASEAALGVFRFDDAERFLHESTRRAVPDSWGNPFQHLAQLYLAEGRIPEAIAALRGGQDLRLRRPAWLDQHGQARLDQTVAALLLVVGESERAEQISERARTRPDRQGVHSGTESQATAAAAVIHAVALRDRAARLEEDAVTATWWQGVKLRARAARGRIAAWREARQAAVLLADPAFLVRTLRPYYVGGADLPQWLIPEMVDMVGAGVVLESLEAARTVEKHATAQAYFDVIAAQAELSRGRWAEAYAVAERALQTVPRAEVLMAGRAHAIAGEAARQAGDRARASSHFAAALIKDPGVLRRLDLALPVAVESDGGDVARAAAKLVDRSPRFRVESDAGLHVVALQGEGACLLGPRHEVVQCVSVTAQNGESASEAARRLVAELHKVAFAYKADLSQADLTSLDGSPTAARADHEVKSLLHQLGDPPR